MKPWTFSRHRWPMHGHDRLEGPVGDLTIRTATRDDAEAIDALLRAHRADGDPMPRHVDDIRHHAERFIVCDAGDRIVACAELVRLAPRVAEIRSMTVDREARHIGVSDRLMNDLRNRARTSGFESLCAFTDDARAFIQYNFSIVPHVWLPEKLLKEDQTYPSFDQCGRYALLLPLTPIPRVGTPGLPRHAAVA